MKKEIFLEQWKNERYRFKVLRIVIVILAFTILVEAFFLNVLARRSRTIIVPTHLYYKFEVSDYAANESYVRTMLIYLTNLVYNFTPATIQERFYEFTFYVPPRYLPEIKKMLDRQIQQVATTRVAQDFQLTEFYRLDEHLAAIKGNITRYLGGKIMGEDYLYLKIGFGFKGGSIEISEFKAISQADYRKLLRSHNITA